MNTVLVAPSSSRRLLPMLAAAMLAFVLLVGAGATTRVGAQPVGPGVDGVSVACRDLQDQANGLIAQYGAIGGADPSSDQLPGIIAQLQQLGTTWRQIGCQAAFGNITGPGIVRAPIAANQFAISPGAATRQRANG